MVSYDDILEEAIQAAIQPDGSIDISYFEDILDQGGFMIVPIEDPTNLRFGVDE